MRNVDLLTEALVKCNFHASALIPLVEEIIQMEQRTLEANKLIENIDGYLENEYRVSHAEILLCLLRRHPASRD